MFLKGLYSVDNTSISLFDRRFVHCKIHDRESILTHLENRETYKGVIGKIRRKLLGQSFMEMLKQHVVQGYCTSKLGATKALVYEPIPMIYRGCVSLVSGQRAWATN